MSVEKSDRDEPGREFRQGDADKGSREGEFLVIDEEVYDKVLGDKCGKIVCRA